MATGVIRAAALLAALLAAAPAAALQMERLTTRDGRQVLKLSGDFVEGDGARFVAAVNAGPVDEVWFDSGGGRVTEGYAIGETMRRVGLIARVPQGSTCASACVDAFLGAPIRFVDADRAIGVHPGTISNNKEARDRLRARIEKDGDEGARKEMARLEMLGNASAAAWIQYVMRMGVSSGLVAHAARIPPNCMMYLTLDDMKLFNVVNTAGPPPPGYAAGEPRGACW